MTRSFRAEIASAERATLGEGPVWDVAAGRLYWIDIFGRTVFVADADGRTLETRRLDRMPGCVLLDADGGIVLATDEGLLHQDRSGATTAIDPVLAALPGQRFNDGATDPRGRAFVGTAALDDATGSCGLFRLDGHGGMQVVLDGVTLSNGLGWSPDGATFYYVDTPTGRVDAFDYDADTGSLAGRREFARIAAGTGIPDGLTVDADGGVWVAVYGGHRLQRHAPDGRVDAVIEFDIPNVTSCAFGGPGLDTLFITTARVDQDDDFLAAHPHAGALYRADVGRRGIARTTWER